MAELKIGFQLQACARRKQAVLGADDNPKIDRSLKF
jgi:hypothetical protein